MNGRLYYGSGERRFLTIQHSSDSLFSEFSAGVHPSPLVSRSPNSERFTPIHQLPRQHPQFPASVKAPSASAASQDGSTTYPQFNVVHQVRKQTSSIWSPHLRRDRRSHRYSLWRPPSTVWVASGRNSRPNNVQAVLFILGFVFPFGKDEFTAFKRFLCS
jgi:hypothetical protein